MTIFLSMLFKLSFIKMIFVILCSISYLFNNFLKTHDTFHVLDSKSRNIPEVVIVRRGAIGALGIWRGWVSWVKGGANGVSLRAT